LSGFAVVVVTSLTLATGCAGGSSPTPTPAGSAKPVIRPNGNIVPPTGGGDVPETTLAVCRECQRLLEAGQNEVLIQRMSQVALQRQVTGGQASQPSARAVALVCSGAAKTNLGQYTEAIENLEKAEEIREDLPAATRPQLLELLYHAQLISYMATGENDKAQQALSGLSSVGQDPARYVEQACAVARAPQTLPECRSATPVPSLTSSTPSPSEPEPSETSHTFSTEPTPSDSRSGIEPEPEQPAPVNPEPEQPAPVDPDPDPDPDDGGPAPGAS
jgi:hypothetical protein